MTVTANSLAELTFLPDGATTRFPLTGLVFRDGGDLFVVYTAGGIETVLVLGIDFNVSGFSLKGKAVLATVATLANGVMTVTRRTPPRQSFAFGQTEQVATDQIEAALDDMARQVMDVSSQQVGDLTVLQGDLSALTTEVGVIDARVDTIEETLADLTGTTVLPAPQLWVDDGQSNTGRNALADSGDKTPDTRVKVLNWLTGNWDVMTPGVFPCAEAEAPYSAPNLHVFHAAKKYVQATGGDIYVILRGVSSTSVDKWIPVSLGGVASADNNFDATQPVLKTAQSVTSAALANPIRLTIAGHNRSPGDPVEAAGFPVAYGLNGNRYLIDVVDANTIALRGVDATGFAAYVAGGTVALVKPKVESLIAQALATPTMVALGITVVHRYIRAQGESDSGLGKGPYYTIEVAFQTYIRAKPWWGLSSQFIHLEMSRRADYADINAAINEVYKAGLFANYTVVSSLGVACTIDDHPEGDTTHYAGTGQVEMGSRIFEAMRRPRAYLGADDSGVVLISDAGSEASPIQIDTSVDGQVHAMTANGVTAHVNMDPRPAVRGAGIPLHNYSQTGILRLTCDIAGSHTVTFSAITATNPGKLFFTSPQDLTVGMRLLFNNTGISVLDAKIYEIFTLDFTAGTMTLSVNGFTALDGTGWTGFSAGSTATIQPRLFEDARSGERDVDHLFLFPGESVLARSYGSNADTRQMRIEMARIDPDMAERFDALEPGNMLPNGDFHALDTSWDLNQWANDQTTPGWLVGDIGTGHAASLRSISHAGFTDKAGAGASADALVAFHKKGVACSEGDVMRLRYYEKTSGATMSSFRTDMLYYDAAGTLLRTDTAGNDTGAYAAFTRKEQLGASPAPAGTVRCVPQLRMTKSAGTVEVSGFDLRRAADVYGSAITATTSLAVGGGSTLTFVAKGAVVWDAGSIAAAGNATQTLTVTGAATGDVVQVSASIDLDGLVLSARVTSANTVTVRLYNATAGAIDPASATYSVIVTRAA